MTERDTTQGTSLGVSVHVSASDIEVDFMRNSYATIDIGSIIPARLSLFLDPVSLDRLEEACAELRALAGWSK